MPASFLISVRFRVALVAAVLAALAPASHAQATVQHPTAPNLRARETDVSVSLRDTVARDPRLRLWRDALVGARRADSVGSLDGEVQEAFGTIVDLAVSGSIVAVLDQSQMRVVLLNRDLGVLGDVGRQGSGPSEFRAPINVTIVADTLRVYDAALGLKTFVLSVSPRFGARMISAVQPVVAVQTLCFRNGGMYAIAPSSLQPGRETARDIEPLVSILRPDGSVGGTFGESYASPSPLVRRMMSEGVIGCDARGRALIGLVKLPFVTAYSEDGRSMRRLRVRDFELSRSLERPNARGQMSIGLDPETRSISTLSRIVHLEGDVFAVQVSRFELSPNRRSFPEVEVQTYLLSLSSFEAVSVGNHLPRIGHVDSTYLYTFANEPFPRLVRLRLGGATRAPRGEL